MKNFLNFSFFKEAFKINSEQAFILFNNKLLDEINRNFHKKMFINSLSIHTNWSNRTGNRDVVLKGTVRFGPEISTLHGEIVWLTKLNTFRGHLIHSFVDTSSSYCLNQARIAFRSGEYDKCLAYLSLIPQDDKLKKSVVKLEQLANTYINN